jgi:hypothetical protein
MAVKRGRLAETGSAALARRKMRRLLRIAAATVLLNTVNAVAQEALSPVVVSASALPLTEAAVNQHASVFTREQIEREAL